MYRLTHEVAPSQASRIEDNAEILHACLYLENPRQRWILSRYPAISPAFSLAEVIWILSGRNDSKFVNYFNSQLPKFAGDVINYHGAYGHRMRCHFSIDQIKRSYLALRENKDSRQVVMQIWDPNVDLPCENGDPSAQDIPCNVCSILKVRGGCLEWTQIMRSNDAYRGLPFNVVQFTTLQEIFAGWLGLDLGPYHHYSDSLHLYKSDMRNPIKVMRGSSDIPQNLDVFDLNFDETERVVAKISTMIDMAIDDSNSAEKLLGELEGLQVSTSWKNVASVIVAEACRKRNDKYSATHAMSQCKNSLYGLMIQRWFERVKF